jgi:F-type H+-transporting ATPase subunit b
MPIDWFTVFAQAVNFLILVWLLRRFLYKPILDAIDKREQGIAGQLAQAEAKKAEAETNRNDFQHKSEAFDQERETLLKKAMDETHAERQRLFDEARKDADSLRAKRQEALQSEQQNLTQEISNWTQKEVFAITRKALIDLSATSLEERMCAVFIQRLQDLSSATKEHLATALNSLTHPAHVRSAFDLQPEQRTAIQNTLNEIFSADIHLQFETVPELISGIELSAMGQKIAWSIDDYLTTLEKEANELLNEMTKPVSNTRVKPDPKSEPQHVHEQVASAQKADH